MKKISYISYFAGAVSLSFALSLSFMACSNESSASAPELGSGSVGSNEKPQNEEPVNGGPVEMHVGQCIGSGLDAYNLKKGTDSGKAYLISGENGYQVYIPNLGDYCSVFGELLSERIGDTLSVWFNPDNMGVSKCVCNKDHWFDISDANCDIKYFKYSNGVYEVVRGSAPEWRSSSSEEVSLKESSSSQAALSVAVIKSSSSAAPVLSSSSVHVESSSSAVANPSHVKILDATAQCGTRDVVDDPMVDGTTPVQKIRPKDEDYALPPVTYRHVATERTGFSIENVTMTCGVKIVSLDVYVSGDTVYVNGEYDATGALRCLCPSKVDFTVDSDPAFSRARWLVFDARAGSYSYYGIEIVDLDVITVEEVMKEQTTKDVNVECKYDRQTTDMPSLTNSTLLPVLDTASTKKIYAMRFDNKDGSETISINELDIGCGVKDLQFDVYASDDTLYVKVPFELYATNCLCPSRVEFTIQKGLLFTNTHYLVFDNGRAMPLVAAKQ